MDPAATTFLDPERAADLAERYALPAKQGAEWTGTRSHERRRTIRDALDREPLLTGPSDGLDHLATRHLIWAHAMLHNTPWGQSEAFGELTHPEGHATLGTGPSGTRVPLALEMAFFAFGIATHAQLTLHGNEAVSKWLDATRIVREGLKTGLPRLIRDEEERRRRLHANREPLKILEPDGHSREE